MHENNTWLASYGSHPNELRHMPPGKIRKTTEVNNNRPQHSNKRPVARRNSLGRARNRYSTNTKGRWGQEKNRPPTRKGRRLETADILFFAMGALTYFTTQTSTRVEVAHIHQTRLDTPQLPETRDMKMRPPSLETRTWPTHHANDVLLKPEHPNIPSRENNTNTCWSTPAPQRPQHTNIPGGKNNVLFHMDLPHEQLPITMASTPTFQKNNNKSI